MKTRKKNRTKIKSQVSSVSPSHSPSHSHSQADWTPTAEREEQTNATLQFNFLGLVEHRDQIRISERELGHVKMSLKFPGTPQWQAVKLWDFTAISFGVIIPYTPKFIDSTSKPTEKSDSLQVGDQVEIKISVTSNQTFSCWCEVKNTVAKNEGTKIGLRRLDVHFPQSVQKDRREFNRLPLAPLIQLVARIKHPFLFGHWCSIQVSDINPKMGFSFTCQDESILLFDGMELELYFELAGLRKTTMLVRVSWVHATVSNRVKFGVECMDIDLKLHNGLCSFLLFSHFWTPSKLRELGFRSQQVKNKLRFRTVKNMQDYAEVLYLRRDAYVGVGKKPEGTPPESMAGPLDGMSRILMAHHHDTIVGSMTFTYPLTQDTLLDSERGFPGQKYPTGIPPKVNLIEVSLLCIHQEYRSTDLLQGLFEHGIKHFLMSDRHWLLTSAVTELLPTYQRIGFKKLNMSYKHPGLNFKEHHMIIANRNAFLWGKGVNPLVWNSLFGEVIDYLTSKNLIKVSVLQKVFIRSKMLLRPFAQILLSNRTQAAFRKHLKTLQSKGLLS